MNENDKKYLNEIEEQGKVEEVMNKAEDMTIPDGDFEAEIWLSTDGKNTVRILAKDSDGRKAGLRWAKIAYDRILKAYGTKQGQAVKEYGKTDKEKQAECNHIHTIDTQVKKPGPNTGKWFTKCTDCGAFIGWK